MTRFQKLAALTLGTAILLGHRRRHRARHRFRAGLPRLAVLSRPGAPPAGRREGLDRVGASHDRGGHRLRDRRPGDPGPARPSRSTIARLALAGGGRARRVPGLARARDRPPRQQRGVGHGAPDGRHAPRGVARVRHGPGRVPGSLRRAAGAASGSRSWPRSPPSRRSRSCSSARRSRRPTRRWSSPTGR